MKSPTKSRGALELGRDAFRRYAWAEAFSAFEVAGKQASLEPHDVEHMAMAAHQLGRDAERDDRLAQAHHDFLRAGDAEGSARCAFWLGFMLLTSGEGARANGWLSRAKRTIDESGRDCVVHGYLRIPPGIRLAMGSDPQAGHAEFSEALAIGQRFGDQDLIAIARQGQGRALLRLGRIPEGLALLDEVMVAVTQGELTPPTVGGVYCSTLDACHEVFDLRRAQEWTATFATWCESQPEFVPFRGHCLVRRAEVMQLKGEWSQALEQATDACEQMSRPPVRWGVGGAFYRQGDLHRLRGEFAAAEEAYGRASELGRQPQPGLALLRLAQGQPSVAAASISHVLDDTQRPETRAIILHASIEILLSAGDTPGARRAADELSVIAASIDAPYLRAASAEGTGAVLLAEGDAPAAMRCLRVAWQAWTGLSAPYEAARVRVLIALAHRALGDENSVKMEFDTARRTAEQLGAGPEVARIDRLRSASAAAPSDGVLTSREIEVLRLLATGQTNRAIAAALGISDKTVARHVSNIFLKLDISSRAAATAYAYEHGIGGRARAST